MYSNISIMCILSIYNVYNVLPVKAGKSVYQLCVDNVDICTTYTVFIWHMFT